MLTLELTLNDKHGRAVCESFDLAAPTDAPAVVRNYAARHALPVSDVGLFLVCSDDCDATDESASRFAMVTP